MFLRFALFAGSELVQGAGGGGALFWGFAVSSAAVYAHQPDSLEWCRVSLELFFNRGHTPFGFEFPVAGLRFFDWFHGNSRGWYSILHRRCLLCIVPLKAFVLRHLRQVTKLLLIVIAALKGTPESQATLLAMK